MKRKFKLFATVASLCLCLALMAFGVYASNNVTYSTSGSVTFEVSDVFVKAETSIYYAENLAKQVNSNTSGLSSWKQVGTTDSRESKDESGNWKALDNYAITDAFNFSTSGVYKVVVKLTNLSDVAIAITTPDLSTGTSLENASLTKDGGNDTVVSGGIAANNGSATLTFYVSLSDAKKAASGSWKISIGLDKASA